eukprot:gene8961-1606_t
MSRSLLCAIAWAPAAVRAGYGDDPALDCGLAKIAFDFGATKVNSSLGSLHDALRLSQCGYRRPLETVSSLYYGQSSQAGLSVYVAPGGNDAGPGSLARPFGTLERARQAVRGTPGSTVFLRGGRYHLNSTFTLSAEDSGVPGRPITYSAYAQEQPVLSGAVPLQLAWSPSPAHRHGVMQAPLPSEAPTAFNSLYVDGLRQVRARYPNGNPQDLSGLCFNMPAHPEEGCSS